MKQIIPRIVPVLIACLFAALIFYSMLIIGQNNKAERIKKQELKEQNFVKHNPDPNF